ncbi:MAG: hypothetical protein H6817_09295 [Phycisphaerales bacterium]|nr:hypothetical protein [Phycisphaerales bacterium]
MDTSAWILRSKFVFAALLAVGLCAGSASATVLVPDFAAFDSTSECDGVSLSLCSDALADCTVCVRTSPALSVSSNPTYKDNRDLVWSQAHLSLMARASDRDRTRSALDLDIAVVHAMFGNAVDLATAAARLDLSDVAHESTVATMRMERLAGLFASAARY